MVLRSIGAYRALVLVIDVAFTRAQLQPADVAVVVDVLRATSTATQALAAGYRRVLCAETIERALQLAGPGRVLAGERRCLKPRGFDQGNSPREAHERRGQELVLATTNGAPTVVTAASRSPLVLLACLLNLDAVRRALCDAGADAAALRRAGLADDIEYCARESELDAVGIVVGVLRGVAAVACLSTPSVAGRSAPAIDASGTVSV